MTTNEEHNEQPADEANQEGTMSRNTPRIKDEAVKNIIVHRNGDMISDGRRIVFNKRQIRTWDSFLEQLTRSLKPQRAAIQRLTTPNHGHIVKAFEDLDPNTHYVAIANGERFRVIDYLNINNPRIKKRRNNPNGVRLPPIIPVYHSKLKVGSRLSDDYQRTVKFIHVFRNGDEFTPPIGVLLTKRYQKSMETLMKALEEKVVLPQNKPLRKVYSMEGHLITSMDEIIDNTHYVAASLEHFINVNYGQVLPAIHGGKVHRKQYENVKYLFKMPTPAKPVPEEGHQSTTPHDAETSSPTRSKSRTDTAAQRKEDNKKSEAATKIQSSYRGYITRQDVQNNQTPKPMSQYKEEQQQTKQKQEEAAAQKKADEEKKGKEEKKPAAQPKQKEKDEKTERKKSTQQQKEKDEQQEEKDEQQEEEDEQQEEEDEQEEEEEKEEDKDKKEMTQEQAATTIQSSIRGYQTRQNVQTTKKQKAEADNRAKSDKAATVIQSSYRGYKTRSETKN